MLLRVLCIVACTCVCARAAHCGTESTEDGPVTCSPSGVFRGSWMETRRGRRFHAYRGIKYAEPPVGELRFKPPQPILRYSGVVNASEEGPICPQPAAPGTYIAEDCLVVNVYTPFNRSSELLPVVFYIHPGGFYSGSGRSIVAGPRYLLDRNLVLVTINHRLGTLGFLSMGDKVAPGNNGYKDQVAALKWVQRNIEAFGGDPNLVTITGYSAGSTSVMLHMISPMSKGLFHRAISMSGSPTSKVPSPSHRMDLAIKQANIVQCPTNTTKAMLLDCFKTKTWEEIAGSVLGFFEFGFDPLSLWRPVVEPDFGQERFLPIEPMDAIRQGKMHPVPYIISQTRDEFFWKAYYVLNNDTLRNTMDSDWEHIAPISFILPRDNSTEATRRLRLAYLGDKPLANDDVTADGLGKLYGDSITAFPVHRLANLMCRHSSQPVYYYMLNYIGNHSFYEDPITMRPKGVAHHDDLIYLLSMPLRFPDIAVADTCDSHLVDRMTALWYNFARYGDPNPRGDTPELGSLQWPPMEPDQRHYLRVDTQLTVHHNLFEDRFKLWDELYPIQY